MFCNFEKNLYSSKAHVNYKCGQNLEISDREIWNSIQYYLSWYEKIGCTAQGDMGVQAVSDPHGDTKGTCLGPCISRGPVRPLLVHSEGDKGEKRKKKDETKWNLGKTRPYTRQHQSRAGGQGQYSSWAGAVTQIWSPFSSKCQKMRSEAKWFRMKWFRTDGRTDGPTDRHSDV